jgi:hypothetical protein
MVSVKVTINMPSILIVGLATAVGVAAGDIPAIVWPHDSAGSAGANDGVPFEATFSDVTMIGSSNYTHFWMPQPLLRVTAAQTAALAVHVDLCGDGTPCPPPGHPQPSGAFFTKASGGGGAWVPDAAADLPTATVIRLNATVTRGFGAIVLNGSDPTNTTATMVYQDWTVGADGRTPRGVTPPGTAAVSGLPPMLRIAYLQSTPSAILQSDGGGGEVAVTQFYGYLASAPKLGGCHGGVAMCYSTVTLGSNDHGASWTFRSAIHWDGTRMPSNVEGPCEPSLVALPDGKTLLSVFRLNSNMNLWQATSTDGGFSWTPGRETAAWAVFPQVRALRNGALVLTAGRPGIGLWLADGRGPNAPAATSWKFYNLARAHNDAVGGSNPAVLYPGPELGVVNASSTPSDPAMTKAYTGLETTGCVGTTCSLLVSYDRLSNGNRGPDPPGPHGPVDAAFTMQVVVSLV